VRSVLGARLLGESRLQKTDDVSKCSVSNIDVLRLHVVNVSIPQMQTPVAVLFCRLLEIGLPYQQVTTASV